MKYFVFSITLLFFCMGIFNCHGKANNINIDSLLQQKNLNIYDTQQVDNLLQIAWDLRNIKPEITVNISQKAYEIALQNRMGLQMSVATSYIGVGYRNMGDFGKALEYSYKSLDVSQKFNLTQRISYACINIGYVFALQGHYSKSLKYLLEGDSLANNLNDSVLLAYSLINLARVYALHQKFEKSLQTHFKALDIRKKQNDEFGVAVSLAEIGEIYLKIKNENKALGYLIESNKICERIDAKTEIAINCNNIGLIYLQKNNTKQAFQEFSHALNLFTQLKDLNGIAHVYIHLSELNIHLKKFLTAVDFANKALEIGNQLQNIQIKARAYKSLSESFEKIKNFEKSLKFQKLHKLLSDSIIENKNIENFTKLEMQFEFDKVEQKYMEEQKKMEIEHKEEILKQKLWRNIFISGLIILIIIALLLFRAYKLKQKHNNNLQIKNQEINQQREEILTQNEALMQQQELILNMANNLKQANEEITAINEQLQRKNENISQSIAYASRIQTAILPSIEDIKRVLEDFFIFYRPLEIVSGDFYWVKKINEFKIFAVADCTGHGIPGAFMSMLSIALLNEIIRRGEITQTNQVLNELRYLVKFSLQQTGKDFEAKDGLDISICVLNTKTNILQYSGANSTAFLISNNQIIELKPDKMPIGIHIEEKDSFSLIEHKVEPGDMVYLFTDGITDQFGGLKGKKFMSSRLKSTLMNIYTLPVERQAIEFENIFDQWKNNIEQIDDMLLLGVKI